MGAVGKTANALRHVESEQNEFDTGGLGSRVESEKSCFAFRAW